MKIVVIGLGYYGKSVAERLSEAGHVIAAEWMYHPYHFEMYQS